MKPVYTHYVYVSSTKAPPMYPQHIHEATSYVPPAYTRRDQLCTSSIYTKGPAMYLQRTTTDQFPIPIKQVEFERFTEHRNEV